MSHLGSRSAKDRWVLPGTAMRVAAGTIFITFQISGGLRGAQLLSPSDIAGAAMLGQASLEQSFALERTAFVGLLVYGIVFAACGAAFGALSAVGPPERISKYGTL